MEASRRRRSIWWWFWTYFVVNTCNITLFSHVIIGIDHGRSGVTATTPSWFVVRRGRPSDQSLKYITRWKIHNCLCTIYCSDYVSNLWSRIVINIPIKTVVVGSYKLSFLWCHWPWYSLKSHNGLLELLNFWTHTEQNMHFTDFNFCVWCTISLNWDVISRSETYPWSLSCFMMS